MQEKLEKYFFFQKILKITSSVQEVPASILKKGLWIIQDSFHNFGPIQGLDTFSVLDINTVEPIFDMIKGVHWDRTHQDNFFGIVFENETHVEIFQLELNTFKMDQFKFVQWDNKWRLEIKVK